MLSSPRLKKKDFNMPQPIRKHIQEIHEDIIKEPPFYTLLIDGGSLLFTSMRDESVNSDGVHYGGIYQFLLQVKMQLSKRHFSYVYVFFDDEYSGKLRYDLYKPYKANRDKHYGDYEPNMSDYMKEVNAKIKSMEAYLFNKGAKNTPKNKWEKLIDENFDRERNILMQMFEELYIRCYMDEVCEGDDLIAYYCKNRKPNEKIVIVSGDADLTQLLCDDIIIYNLNKKVFLSTNNFQTYFGFHPSNVLTRKIMIGDTSDNIGNIKGLSEDGLMKMMPEIKNKPVSVEDIKKRAGELIEERKSQKKKPLQLHENIVNGVSNKQYNGDFYEINKKIIDLSEPILTQEAKDIMDEMMYAPLDPSGRSFENLYGLIKHYNIGELLSETKFASFFGIFKTLEKENSLIK